MVIATPNFLNPQSRILNHTTMRVQELIYGHRIYNEQTPYMILLEFLLICDTKPLGSVGTNPCQHEDFRYRTPVREKLRFLLFRDQNLQNVRNDQTIPENQKWVMWKNRANKQFSGSSAEHDEFAYLDKDFQKNLENLYQAVEILRSFEIDRKSNRRWTSRFLSVFGPSMILPDYRKTATQWDYDRRFFARGGELIYLMLSRSKNAKKVGCLIRKAFLDKNHYLNKIAEKLSDNENLENHSPSIGYLPYSKHEVYDQLGEDWCRILNNKLPRELLFEPLFRVTGLSLLRYIFSRSNEECSKELFPIILDLTDGKNRKIREAAKENYNQHRHYAKSAVSTFIEKKLSNDTQWNDAKESNDISAATNSIRECFHFNETFDENTQSVSNLLKSFTDIANNRSRSNIYDYIPPLSRESGVLAARPNLGTWFCIDDSLLFALVLTNVDETVELQDFLKKLYTKYQLVIGPAEARIAFPESPTGEFRKNLAAFEFRLTKMALTKRLSDDCAFVRNPFSEAN